MGEPDETPWHLLTRHLSGVATPEEERQLHAWVGDHESRAALLRGLSAAWRATGKLPARHDVEAGWARVRRRIDGAESSAGEPIAPHDRAADVAAARSLARRRSSAPSSLGKSRARRPLIAAAAAVVIAAGLAVGWRPLTRALIETGQSPTADLALRETTTARGQRAVMRLRDGTRVTLAPASRLGYPDRDPEGPGGTRDVYLEGQAYFEVAHDSTHPFVVHARGTDTRVRGTKFVVRAYASDSTIQVAVNEGEVAFGRERQSPAPTLSATATGGGTVILRRGAVGRMVPGGAPAIEEHAQVASYLAWINGTLVFRDAPLRDVLPELARTYGVEFRLADSALARRRLTATLGEGSLRDLLTIMRKVLDVCVAERERGTVVLSRRTAACAVPTAR